MLAPVVSNDLVRTKEGSMRYYMNLTATARPFDTTKLFLDIVKGNHHILSPVDNLDLIKSNKHNKLYDEEYLTRSDIVPY